MDHELDFQKASFADCTTYLRNLKKQRRLFDRQRIRLLERVRDKQERPGDLVRLDSIKIEIEKIDEELKGYDHSNVGPQYWNKMIFQARN